MTREEAVEELYRIIENQYRSAEKDKEALGMAIKALEQEPIINKDCAHCSKTYGTLGCCDTVSNEWVYSCKEGQREYLLNKIRAEIDIARFIDKDTKLCKNSNASGLEVALQIIDKYRVESEG